MRSAGVALGLALGTGIAGAWGCATQGEGEGSETHFLDCETDADCPATAPYCVAERCRESPKLGCSGVACETDGGWTVDGCDSTHVSGGKTSIQFRIENASGAPLALWNGCQLSHAITSCVDAYTEPLPTWVFCAPTCPATDCLACGGCDSSPAPVEGSTTIGWNGTLAREEAPGPGGGCACTEWVDAPPGRYRIRVPVFAAEPPLIEGIGPGATILYEVEADFTLPDEDGIVKVPIDVPPWVTPCDGGACLLRLSPDAPSAACTPEADPALDCPAAAPRRYRCERPLPLGEGCVDPYRRELAPTEGGVVRCCP